MLFISYAHENTGFAQRLCDALMAEGMPFWRYEDAPKPIVTLPTQVEQALNRSTAFVVIWSQDAANSAWVELELSAALMRRADDPSYRVVPIVIDDAPIRLLLKAFYNLDARQLDLAALVRVLIAEACPQESRPTGPTGDVYARIFKLLEGDQFLDDPQSPQFGGWGRSYRRYLALAYSSDRPAGVAVTDSVSVTYWVMRGLASLRRLVRTADQDLTDRLDTALLRARAYLHRHFDGTGAGLIRFTSQGEDIRRDPRHSATFVKALRNIAGEDLSELQQAAHYAVTRFEYDTDWRLTSSAEVYSLACQLEIDEKLRDPRVTAIQLYNLRKRLEEHLMSAAFEAACEGGTAPLLREPRQPHMSLFYTWWVLDACGEHLLSSPNAELRRLAEAIIAGLPRFAQRIRQDMAFPLAFGHTPDLGMSAQVGEVLLRLSGTTGNTTDIARFVENGAQSVTAEYPYTFLLWSVPVLLERHTQAHPH